MFYENYFLVLWFLQHKTQWCVLCMSFTQPPWRVQTFQASHINKTLPSKISSNPQNEGTANLKMRWAWGTVDIWEPWSEAKLSSLETPAVSGFPPPPPHPPPPWPHAPTNRHQLLHPPMNTPTTHYTTVILFYSIWYCSLFVVCLCTMYALHKDLCHSTLTAQLSVKWY